MLKYENVTFIKDAVKDMTKEQFVAAHVDVFWQDRDKETREKMLAEVYGLIAGKKPKK